MAGFVPHPLIDLVMPLGILRKVQRAEFYSLSLEVSSDSSF